MKIIILFFCLLVFGCGYPDIDSIPDFNKTFKSSDEEIIDLCQNEKLSSENDDICKEINNENENN